MTPDKIWEVRWFCNDLHVMPLNDKREHEWSADCPCRPDTELVGATLLVIHDAFDFRHIMEVLNEPG